MIPARLKPFLPYLAAYRREILIGIASLLVTDALTMVVPWIIKLVIDTLPRKPPGTVLIQYAGALMLTALGLGLARYGWRRYLFGPSRKMEVDIQNRLFEHFLTLDRTWFERQKIGDLMSRATNDLRAVKDFLGLGLLIFIDAVAVIVASIALMLYISVPLTLVCLVPLPLVSLIFFGFIRKISERHQAIQENLSRISAQVQENLAGIRVLHAFVQEENEKRKFDALNREHIRRNLSLARLFGLFTPSLVFTLGVASMICLWMGGRAVIAGEITLGSFVAFNGYLLLLSWPMMAIGYIINLTQKGLTAMGRLQEIFRSRSSLSSPSGVPAAFELQGKLEFRNVGFRYPQAPGNALTGIQLQVPAGGRVRVTGPVGAGKTTLAQLLVRLYDATEGTLLIDGHPIRDLPLEALRREIAYVDQEPFLFSATVRENIALARPEATDEEIESLVRAVNLGPDVAAWPEGLETLVGERGVSLSGGQKQRIALARALIKRPRILVLDDAFSSLDGETEQVILKNIEPLLEGVTTLMITHRLAAAPPDAFWVVLDGGRIIESGTHRELMARRGYYHRVYSNQALAREMEITLQ